MKTATVFIFLSINSLTLTAQDYLRKLNDTIPNITFTSINGSTYNTHELKGKIIVLNFWYTHCPPCVSELPDFEILEKKYKDSNVVVLYLSKDSAMETKNLLLKKGLSIDAIADTQETHTLFEIQYYPTTVIIDRLGVIRKSCSSVPYTEKCLKMVLDEG